MTLILDNLPPKLDDAIRRRSEAERKRPEVVAVEALERAFEASDEMTARIERAFATPPVRSEENAGVPDAILKLAASGPMDPPTVEAIRSRRRLEPNDRHGPEDVE